MSETIDKCKSCRTKKQLKNLKIKYKKLENKLEEIHRLFRNYVDAVQETTVHPEDNILSEMQDLEDNEYMRCILEE